MSGCDVLGLLLEAVNFAATKHRDQRRKDVLKTPYINHPIGVAYLLWKEGGVTDVSVLQVGHRININFSVLLCEEVVSISSCIISQLLKITYTGFHHRWDINFVQI